MEAAVMGAGNLVARANLQMYSATCQQYQMANVELSRMEKVIPHNLTNAENGRLDAGISLTSRGGKVVYKDSTDRIRQVPVSSNYQPNRT